MFSSSVARRSLVALAVLAVLVSPTAAGGGVLQHVTLIGDSVATAIADDRKAGRVIGLGSDVDLEVAACRRLIGQSCPPDPPTAVEVIKRLGPSVGPTVVIAVGYNDFEDGYAAAIADTLATLDAAGVKRVFWVNLRAARHPYVNMNVDIAAAAARDPKMTVIDWNVHSRSHPDWFQADGIHLLEPGTEAFATLIHDKLVDSGVAVPPVRIKTVSLPAAKALKAYRMRLAAGSGQAPYTWSLAGHLPVGLHQRANGLLSGKPRGKHPGLFKVTVQVRDAVGQVDARTLVLRLR